MAVYFAIAPTVNAMKVGFSTDVALRVRSIRNASPVPVELVSCDPRGDLLTEAEVQHRLRADRMRPGSDWFVASRDVRDLADLVGAAGRVPGGWYLPPKHAPRDRHPRGAAIKDLTARFGISLADYVEACEMRSVPAAGDYHLSIERMPYLYHWLRAHGHDCTVHDLFPSRTSAEAA